MMDRNKARVDLEVGVQVWISIQHILGMVQGKFLKVGMILNN